MALSETIWRVRACGHELKHGEWWRWTRGCGRGRRMVYVSASVRRAAAADTIAAAVPGSAALALAQPRVSLTLPSAARGSNAARWRVSLRVCFLARGETVSCRCALEHQDRGETRSRGNRPLARNSSRRGALRAKRSRGSSATRQLCAPGGYRCWHIHCKLLELSRRRVESDGDAQNACARANNA